MLGQLQQNDMWPVNIQIRLGMRPVWSEFSLYSKICVKRSLLKRPKTVFQDQLSLNAGQKYCRMLPPWSILQYFRPSLSYHLSLRPLFSLFLSGRFTQVLLNVKTMIQNPLLPTEHAARLIWLGWFPGWSQFLLGAQVYLFSLSCTGLIIHRSKFLVVWVLVSWIREIMCHPTRKQSIFSIYH